MAAKNKRRGQRGPRGQAMVEYSVVSYALLIGTGPALLKMILVFVEALDTYFKGIYAVLQSSTI